MNNLIKRLSVLLFFVAAPLSAEEVVKNSAEQLGQKQGKIMQLEIELLELKLNNEKRKVEEFKALEIELLELKLGNEKRKVKELEAKVEVEKNNQAEKAAAASAVATEEKKKEEVVIDDELQSKHNTKKPVAKPVVASINDDFKIRFGASYLYNNELTIEKNNNNGINFFEPYEGRMINEKTTEGSVEIQSPHFYFSSTSKIGILFSAGYQRFEFDRQEIDYTNYDNGTTVNLGTRAQGDLFYLTPIIFVNPLRNASVNQSLVLGFGLGLSHISAQGTTRLTEPSYLSGNDQAQYYNVSDTGAILKLTVDYQWRNIYLGLFVQSSIIRNNGDDYIYTSSGINAGFSFNM